MLKRLFSNFLLIKKILFVSLILFLLDILTKSFFTGKSYFKGSVVYIKYSQNYGSAFSMFSNYDYYNYLIIFLSFVVLYFLFKNVKEFTKTSLTKVAFCLLISGTLGNLFDRVVFGYVRDFIGIKYLFIFNFADVYLSLAVILYICYEFELLSFISSK
jgi:signal peptidase II